MGIIELLILVLLVVALLAGPYTGLHGYGWGPSGIISLVLVMLLIFLILGYI